MTTHLPERTTSVADARAGLSRTLKEFRSNSSAPPVVLGSHRNPEAVLMPYPAFLEMLDSGPTAIDRPINVLRKRRELVLRLAEINHIEAVAVFGSVARGTDTAESDVDLLVDAAAGATLFDLAQFEIDMEHLLERDVDVVSRSALDPRRDQDILAEAVPL